MGLRCLLGHDFSEPELQRDREEDGNEVVTTVTEVKTCARCGETQVVSENTEVTTMEQLAEEAAVGAETTTPEAKADETAGPGSAPDEIAESKPAESSGTVALADTDAAEEDAVIIDEGPTDTSGSGESTADTVAETAGADDAADDATDDGGAELLDEGEKEDGDGSLGGDGEYAAYPDTETAEASTADEGVEEADDGVILDEAGDEDGDRERGAWPAVDETQAAGEEPTPWPEQRGEDEGFSAEIDEGDADGSVEFGGGLTPEAAETEADEDVEYVTAPERDETSGAGKAGGADSRDRSAADEGMPITRGASPNLGTASDEVTTEYYCPECEMTRSADGNSMRAGDICPECKRGYVDERPI
ncbi:DUF7093 family protein [Halorubrum laminariae]|uniref:Oxidoreductase n=1 Tax=Halorubrum laminariae TaxID=1433523 RepID=A0ABD6C0B1_9EURY|nr:hypothetical protein [Halorubrum laminariae]